MLSLHAATRSPPRFRPLNCFVVVVVGVVARLGAHCTLAGRSYRAAVTLALISSAAAVFAASAGFKWASASACLEHKD